MVEAEAERRTIRDRAARGVVLVATRGVAVRLVGLAGIVVLARLLVPSEFGTVAFGLSVAAFARALTERGGVGVALVGRREPPSRDELKAAFGLQLLIGGVLAVAIASVAYQFGLTGRVTALIALSAPLTAPRSVGAIVLERDLRYGPLITVDVTEVLVFYGWAIATVAAGWGVWGFASAAVVRAAVGTAVMVAVARVGLPAPAWSWQRWRELIPFGARYQAITFVNVTREQSLNVGTAAIAGIASVGLWTLAGRLLQGIYLLLESLWRVAFPATARLLEAGENPRILVERGMRMVAAASGLVLVPLVGAAPAFVPSLFGPAWADAADVLPGAALGVMIGAPVAVVGGGYLYAVGDAATVLRSVALHGIAWAAVAFPLLPVLGVSALGVGGLAAGVVEAVVVGARVRALAGAPLFSPVVAPVAAAVVAAGAGWIASSSVAHNMLAIACGVLASAGLYVGILLVVRRAVLLELVGVARRSVRGAAGAPAA